MHLPVHTTQRTTKLLAFVTKLPFLNCSRLYTFFNYTTSQGFNKSIACETSANFDMLKLQREHFARETSSKFGTSKTQKEHFTQDIFQKASENT